MIILVGALPRASFMADLSSILLRYCARYCVLKAEFISLGVFRLLLAERSVSRCLAVSDPLGLGPVTCRVIWACGPVNTIRHYVPQSSVSSVCAEGATRLRSIWLLAVSGFGCVFRTPLGTRIVTTIHLPSFSSSDEGCGHMCLLDFVKSADPFKVKVGERTLTENEVPLVTETEDRVISPSLQTISLVDHTIRDELNVNSGKKKKKVAFASGSPPAKKARTEGIDVTYSSVTPTPKFAHEDASHDNVRTRPASGRFVVLSSGSTDADIPASPRVVLPVTLDSTGVNAPVFASMGGDHRSSSSGLEAGGLSATPSQDSSADDFYESPVTCRNLLDHVTPLAYWAALRNQHDATFLDDVNVNSAQHRDGEIVDLNTQLEKSEAEAAEVIELRKRVSDLEATVALNVGKLATLCTGNVGLVEKFFALESESDGLKNQVVGEGKMQEEFQLQQDAAERRFAERASELDARIVDVHRDMDNNLYPHMLTTIAGRRWVIVHGIRLAVYKCTHFVECRSAMGKVISMAINKGIQQGLEAGVVHGKAGRSLAQLEAYDLEVEEKYVATVCEFENKLFPLLDELESLKDSPLASIMFALVLKDDHGDVIIYFVRRFAERRGLCPPPSTGNSGSVPPPGLSLDVADYQVLSDDGGSASQPPIVQAHDDLFNTSVLDGAGA
ncbi:hypothetical protein Tco_0506061 [Tanacetum coccineum]